MIYLELHVEKKNRCERGLGPTLYILRKYRNKMHPRLWIWIRKHVSISQVEILSMKRGLTSALQGCYCVLLKDTTQCRLCGLMPGPLDSEPHALPLRHRAPHRSPPHPREVIRKSFSGTRWIKSSPKRIVLMLFLSKPNIARFTQSEPHHEKTNILHVQKQRHRS